MKAIIRNTCIAVVFTAMAVQHAHALEFVVSDLGSLGGTENAAYNINDLGQVVGGSTTASGERHAFLWTKEGGMVDIGVQIGGENSATAINDQGQVVGGRGDTMNDWRAFLWTAANGVIDLGTLGGNFSIPSGINKQGQVVGYSQTADGGGDIHGFIWSDATGMVDIGTFGGLYTVAADINDLGQVVGLSDDSDGLHVFLWTASDGMRDLSGPINAQNGVQVCINNIGQVVMSYGSPSGGSHPYLLLPGGGLRDLGTLGGDTALAQDINDLGQVVGTSQTPDGTYHAFFWSEETGMIELGTLGSTSSIAEKINSSGQIVGMSLSASSPLGDHALLWTLPKPQTPQEQVADMISEVKELLSNGEIARGEAMAMLAKLDTASALFTEGEATAGCNVLQAFINHVTARMKTGKIPADEAQALIDAAQSVNGCEVLQ